jgi:signal transduction histidine kinase
MTVAILVLVAATLVLTSLGSFYFIRRAVISSAQQDLARQAGASAEYISTDHTTTLKGVRRELRVIAAAGAFAGIDLVRLYPNGTISGSLPSGLTAAQLDVPRLQRGEQTAGHTSGMVAYSAVPTTLPGLTGFKPVLVITRQIRNPVNGLRYFVLVGAAALLIAALVAAGLARQLTRPLVAAVQTTRRIAAGDLDATVPVGRHDDPEFAQLAEAINTMGANLVRARDQERQFILSVSHELRTPLTSIRGYADAIVDGATDDPPGAAAVIGAEAGRLERLVQDLLDLARLDADRFSLDFRTVDAAAMAAMVAEGFRPRARELGLELAVAAGSDETLWVVADPDRLGQIVANLVENASSFARGRIDIGTGRTGEWPVIWVADDGPGIQPDQLSQVFERHFVSDRVRGRRVGSGLGLAIVSELAAAMGARVWAESPLTGGTGTRMVVALRPGSPPADPPLRNGPARSNPAGTPSRPLMPASAGPAPAPLPGPARPELSRPSPGLPVPEDVVPPGPEERPTLSGHFPTE